MDLSVQYCPHRRNLEEKVWFLVSRLSVITSQLFSLVGKDHVAFAATKLDCVRTREEITESSRLLGAHRFQHGC